MQDELLQELSEVALKLKHCFQSVVCHCREYGHDAKLTHEVDTIGRLAKEVEDLAVVLRIQTSEQ